MHKDERRGKAAEDTHEECNQLLVAFVCFCFWVNKSVHFLWTEDYGQLLAWIGILWFEHQILQLQYQFQLKYQYQWNPEVSSKKYELDICTIEFSIQ